MQIEQIKAEQKVFRGAGSRKDAAHPSVRAPQKIHFNFLYF